MKATIVNYIVCPVCKKELTLKVDKWDGHEVNSGSLSCILNHEFPITNGVPRLLVNISGSVEQVKNSFSDKWKRFETETFSKKEIDFQLRWYLERYGFKSKAGLADFLKDKGCILDAGCGVGRSVDWFSDRTLAPVFGVDISESVDIAYEHYGHRHNVHIIQADIMNLPFKVCAFDYISCDQVIHHTPQPEIAFNLLVNLLSDDGQIAVYTYRKRGPIREFTNDYLRNVTTNMTTEECLDFADSVTELAKSLSDINATIEIKKDISLLDIKSGTYSLQRFFYWNVMKAFWDDNGDRERALAVNFDWYHPKHAFRYTPEEIMEWFKSNNLQIVNFSDNESGISVRGSFQ